MCLSVSLKGEEASGTLFTFKRRLYGPRSSANVVLPVKQNGLQKDMILSAVLSSRVSITIMLKLISG
jgi:hypothetical protein